MLLFCNFIYVWKLWPRHILYEAPPLKICTRSPPLQPYEITERSSQFLILIHLFGYNHEFMRFSSFSFVGKFSREVCVVMNAEFDWEIKFGIGIALNKSKVRILIKLYIYMFILRWWKPTFSIIHFHYFQDISRLSGNLTAIL